MPRVRPSGVNGRLEGTEIRGIINLGKGEFFFLEDKGGTSFFDLWPRAAEKAVLLLREGDGTRLEAAVRFSFVLAVLASVVDFLLPENFGSEIP